MKVLFLDLDGVINTQNKDGFMLTLPFKGYDGENTSITRWNPSCIKPFLKLCELCSLRGYKIVISSTWRLIGGAKEFNEYFRTYFRIPFIHDIQEDLVIGITPRIDGIRGIEIKEWIYKHKHEVENYIVVDDDIYDIELHIHPSKIVQINRETGLTMEDVEKIKHYMW